MRGRETYLSVASRMPPAGDLAHNPGLCLDGESSWWPFCSQASTQSTGPHQPGLTVDFYCKGNFTLCVFIPIKFVIFNSLYLPGCQDLLNLILSLNTLIPFIASENEESMSSIASSKLRISQVEWSHKSYQVKLFHLVDNQFISGIPYRPSTSYKSM